VSPGLKTEVRGSYKFSKGRRLAQDLEHHPRNFYLAYTNMPISEKSPHWKVIYVHYTR